jgi:penicillin-binding protein 1A
MITVGIVLHQFYRDLPKASEVVNYKFDTGSEVYDTHGRLIHMYAFEHRKLIEYSEIPPYMIDMLIQVEDKNFYKHWGIDIEGILRAMYVNFRTGRTTQGASTLSQQLARNMFLSTERVWSRKIKEAMLAVIIEKNFTKQEILEAYLNKVLFGNGYYGLEMASMNYFLKKSTDLNIAESALLIGLLVGSGYYNPIRYPERAHSRRNLVLSIAHENNIITTEQYDQAVNTPMTVNKINLQSNRESDYFIEYIRPFLERRYGTNMLFTGGLKIYTTIDYDLQQFADSVLNQVLSDFDHNRRYRNKYSDVPSDAVNIRTEYLQGGVFAMDPHTGFVRIMVGGRNFKHSKFNRVMQARRQPGSSFKPFLYTAAIENGFTAATIVTDEPLVFTRGGATFWEPRNYTRDFRGPVRLREALQRSINIVAAKTIYDITPHKMVEFCNRLQFTTDLHPFLSLSVGACEVIPFELVRAYTIFPGRGNLVEPVFIERVTDSRGRILEQATIKKRTVISPQTAYVMTDMMKSVVNEGTAASARTRGFRMPAGGKTGTTDDYRDAWFIGFTKNMVMGTWTGFDNNRSMGRPMTGGVAALPIWIPIMNYYQARLASEGVNIMEDFDMPQGIVRVAVSRRTGLLPTDGEPTILENFVEFTDPRNRSDWFYYNFFPNTHFFTAEDHRVEVGWN